MNDLVFLDTETTGLDPDKHEVWEIGVAVNDGPVETFIVPHSLVKADPKALEMNGYWDRANLGIVPRWGEDYDIKLRVLLDGATIVGANPAFDVDFLYRRWGVAPWHHRKIDVESMALLAFRWSRPRGLSDIAKELQARGYDVSSPDHTAENDVIVVRQVYWALRELVHGK